MTESRVLRCAVYTRKSTEEGLEQDFNSLQAQREACEAFIRSQRSEGWTLVPAAYDDGGISGGTMERPALQRLFAHIEEKRVDVIVVYKVDRLTRSLADFSKMVELFDRFGVSFVAVTQQFNTTTSMGRLTLNVLLSFAQFEREVTAERIRDKIAASKKKGLWMGGPVPIGYRVKERRLIMSEYEAEYVRAVYEEYLRLGSVSATTKLIRRRLGLRETDAATLERTKGGFYTLLRNPIYVGLIRHKQQVYPGQHEPIIERRMWDAVQAKLDANARNPGWKAKPVPPLKGKLFDEYSHPLGATTVTKKGKRYRYYLSRGGDPESEMQARTDWKLPALDIERRVADLSKAMLADHTAIVEAGQANGLKSDELKTVLHNAKAPNAAHNLEWVERVTLYPDRLIVVLQLPARVRIRLERTVPLALRQRGKERRLVIGGGLQPHTPPDPQILKALRTGMRFWHQLMHADKPLTAVEFAEQEKVDNRYVGRTLQLAFLAPDVMEQLVLGRHAPEWTADRLIRCESMPVAWEEQRVALI